MDFPKKQAQRLMPLYLLEYSEKLFENHPDPEAPWGGGGGDYTAGNGIDITNDVISVDNTIARKSDIPSLTGYATEQWVLDKGYITSTDLLGYATEQWVQNQGYLTSAALTNYITTTQLEDALDDYALKTDIPENVSDLNNDAGYTTQTWVENQGYITGINSSDVIAALGYTPGTSNFSGSYNDLTNKPDLSIYAESSDLATVATSGSYNDLSNKPTIPTVNDPTITFTQGGVTKGSITLNQASNQTIALDAGGTLPDSPFLNVDDPNDQMFFSLDGSDFSWYKYVDLSASNRLFYVNLSALNPVFKNGLTSTYNTQTNQLEVELNAVIPTATSDLINDSGFITGITSSDVTTALGYTPGTSNFSGSYNDLTNKPTIPDAVSGTNDGTNWTTLTIGSDTYDIPQGGGSTPGMIGEVIYDVPNGEAGVNPITMLHSFADYSYVDIQYRCYDNAYEVKCVRVYDPNGKHVYLDWDVLVSGAVYAKKSIYELSGNTMTVRNGSDMQVYYSNGSTVGTQATATTDYQHQIKITKVIGYKANSSALTTETWTFTLQDGTTVTKKIVVA